MRLKTSGIPKEDHFILLLDCGISPWSALERKFLIGLFCGNRPFLPKQQAKLDKLRIKAKVAMP